MNAFWLGNSIFIVLLTGTLSVKALFFATQSGWHAETEVQAQLVGLLSGREFQINTMRDHPASLPVIAAKRGDCRVLVAEASPYGWHRDVIHQFASSEERVFFAFNGAIYPDQPKWLGLSYLYWRKVNRYIGRELPYKPVIAVVASPNCDLEPTWGGIASING